MAAACLALAACWDNDPLATMPRLLLVHAVIDAGSPDLVVSVEWTENNGTHFEPLATVQLTLPSGQVVPMPRQLFDTVRGQVVAPQGQYRVQWSTIGHSVIPGGTYQLRVVAGGVTATGSTTVPMSFPGPPLVLDTLSQSRDTLRLDWKRVALARSYLVDIRLQPGQINQFGPDEAYTSFADTAVALPANLIQPPGRDVFVAGLTSRVVIAAVDENFHEYYRAITDPLTGATPSRLSGALGVFGSIVPLIRRDYYVSP